MKKLLIVASLLLASVSVQAGLKVSDHTYTMRIYGDVVHVHEWTPKDNPTWTCVFVAGNGDGNSSGVACYPKKK